MTAEAVSLIIGAVVQGLGTLSEIVSLGKQVQAGVPITAEQIAEASAAVESAVARWDAAADKDT